MAEYSLPKLPELSGEAGSGRYSVKTGDGGEIDPSYAIFPVIRYDSEGHVHILGTGFFISTNGLFVTARHVLMAPFDGKGRQQYPIGTIQFLRKGESADYILRPILRCATHPVADLGVGVAAPLNRRDGTPLTNPVLTLDTEVHSVGERITTYAYPKHADVIEGDRQFINMAPTWYDGRIEAYWPNGRDKMLPGPCYQTSIVIHKGASGGPVFSRNGSVLGVNTTGYDGTDLSFVSRIHEILELSIDDVIMGTGSARTVKVVEMVLAGHIILKDAKEAPVSK